MQIEAMAQSNLPDNGNVGATKTKPGFTDFEGLHRDILPFYCARSLREQIRRGVIPSIVLPGSRKRIFEIAAVEAALRRNSKGGSQ